MVRPLRRFSVISVAALVSVGAVPVAAAEESAEPAPIDSLAPERETLELLVEEHPDNIELRIRLDWLENGAIDIAPATDATPRGAVGPDVMVCSLDTSDGPPVRQWTLDTVLDRRSYSIATRSFNAGDTNLTWNSTTHPVISQNLFRLKDGRLEQIGMGWVKHGFCAIQGLACGSCTFDPRCLGFLSPGCADPYAASLNGNQNRLGPRSEVNPVTGIFPSSHDIADVWPGDTAMPGTLSPQGFLAGRIVVLESELDPAQNVGALYFIESQYIHPQDVAAGNDDNNASYRRVEVDPNSFDLIPPAGAAGETRMAQSAIFAWAEHDQSVQVETIDVPADGRFFLASDVTPNGDGTWRYTYAIQNYNSDRAARALQIPSSGATLSSDGFRDVEHHSGDGINGVTYDGADWSFASSAASASWTGPDFQTTPNGNALRWGSMFTFWFDADRPPAAAQATISLFKDGDPEFVSAPVLAPSACPADLDGDGEIGSSDLALLLGDWGTDDVAADLSGDGVVGSQDLAILLGSWGGACPG